MSINKIVELVINVEYKDPMSEIQIYKYQYLFSMMYIILREFNEKCHITKKLNFLKCHKPIFSDNDIDETAQSLKRWEL